MPSGKAPESIMELVGHFQEGEEIFKSSNYNEMQLRSEFVNSLFEALGWDVLNRQKRNQADKDVILEDTLQVEGRTKAPDFAFFINGARKFFVETKRPLINIRSDASSAYQLRRYAWSAKLSLSILTDFEEFAVYDGRVKPELGDKANVARLKYFTCYDFDTKWDEIAALFSREAVRNGSLDQFDTDERNRAATISVDDAFLAEIESWREKLAESISRLNSIRSIRDLNTAVQRTIDRIVFLRIAEDRGLEPFGRLRQAGIGQDTYRKLTDIFRRADSRYNSGLFHFTKDDGVADTLDTFTLNLTIDDKTLKDIISSLYYPISPYEFSVLPADLLGQVYEQFLGKIIIRHGRTIHVEERPEIKKAGGVYYTPSYIVRYIVKNTLGPLLTERALSGRRPSSTSSPSFRVLDLSCGSGSFLIEAYRYLLGWYTNMYVSDNPQRYVRGRNPKLYYFEGRSGDSGEKVGEWRLTIAERRRILLAHIYGVDIDPQAVEVTKLSLLLKVLEGANSAAINRQTELFHTRALPDLDSNIKCGNSIIGPDFYDNPSLDLEDKDLVERINAFDWHVEFKPILKEGGFDIVIGNPPYRRELDYKYLMDDVAATEFGKRFRAPRMDLWYYFVHRGLELLCPTGRLGYIVNSYWVAGTGAEKLVRELREGNLIEEMFDFGKLSVFRRVSGQHMIMLLKRERDCSTIRIKHCIPDHEKSAEAFVEGRGNVTIDEVPSAQVFVDTKINLNATNSVGVVASTNLLKLDQVAIIRQGIAENPSTINKKVNKRFGEKFNVGEGVFMISDQEKSSLNLSETELSIVKPYHDLKDIARYYVNPEVHQHIIYSTKNTVPNINAMPSIKRHLSRFRPIMDARRETANGSNRWWHLHWPREEALWKAPKIIALQMASRPSFALAEQELYCSFSTNLIVPKVGGWEFRAKLLGILNSSWVARWLANHAKRRGVALEINGNVLRLIPLPPSCTEETPLGDDLVRLVRARVSSETACREARTDNSRVAFGRQISHIDEQIDLLVERMYAGDGK